MHTDNMANQALAMFAAKQSGEYYLVNSYSVLGSKAETEDLLDETCSGK